MSPDTLLKKIRADMADIPGVVFNVGQFIAHRMDEVQSGIRSQVAIKIFGDNLSTLYQLGQQVQDLLHGVAGAVTLAQRLDTAGDANNKAAAESNFGKLRDALKSIRENYANLP
jgi:Cu/Ag efflux pump CusA